MAKFVLKPNYEYWWPIKIKIPNSDPKRPGVSTDMTFNAKFSSIGTDEASELLAQRRQDVELGGGYDAFIMRVVTDWDTNVVDEDGQPVPFSENALAGMLTNVWVLKAYWQAWSDSISSEPSK